MTYAKNRALRKELALAFGQKGFQNDSLDNQDIVLKLHNYATKEHNFLGYEPMRILC